jgi:hypothetical protein
MNGNTMLWFLSLDRCTSSQFRGFAMSDSKHLPAASNNSPALYILNTDVESGSGQHWCVAYFPQFLRASTTVCEFFDPYGMSPACYGFDRLLQKYCGRILYSQVLVQGLGSRARAHHCLFFAYHRCHGLCYDGILDMYDLVHVENNERLVTDFVMQFGRIYKLMV